MKEPHSQKDQVPNQGGEPREQDPTYDWYDPKYFVKDVSSEVKQYIEELTTKHPPTTPVVTREPFGNMKSYETKSVSRTNLKKGGGYDIVDVGRNHPANITVGELLQDNPAYRKQLKSLLMGSQRRKRKLPEVNILRMEWEDCGPPEIEIQIHGCVIKGYLLMEVPVSTL